jgi:DNA-binding MarR family transcriptional regulator
MKKKITNIFYDLREVRIVNNLKLKPIHKLVLFVLESRGNDIRPKKSTIAQDCGCSKATIDKAIKDLQKADLIRVKRRFNSSNRYFINKDEFHKVAQELQMEASLKKSIEAEIDDPDYDPWESLNLISGQS